MTKQTSLKTKLIAGFLLSSFFSLAVGGIAYFSSRGTEESYEHVAQVNLPNAGLLADMRAAALGTARNCAMLVNASLSAELRKIYDDRLAGRLKQFKSANGEYEKVPFVEGEKEIHEMVLKDWADVERHALEIQSLTQSHEAESRAQAQKVLTNEFEVAMDKFTEHIVQLRNFQMEQAKLSTAKAHEIADLGHLIMYITIGVGFAISMTTGLFLANMLARRFTSLAEQLLHGANEVASASQQISAASEQLSSSVTEQAASLQETSSSIEEINAMVLKNTENAVRSRSSSEQSRTTAESGQQAVEEVIRSIKEISDSNTELASQVESSNKQIAEIVKVIAEIGDKTKVINDIVFQTKLLSFNASVEAARAGEHGKGFAVVAEEVGNLAQMSGNAAKEISQMLEGRVQMVEGIVRDSQTQMERLMSASREKIEQSNRVAERCGEVLSEVVGQVNEVSLMASEISTASTEQSQGIQEVTKAVSQLDQATQQNASAANQTSSAATEMSEQADQLRGMVSELMLIVRGESHSLHQEAPAQKKQTAAHAQFPVQKNVVKLKKKSAPARDKSAAPSHEAPVEQQIKAASGDDVPRDNDPRFRDI